MVRTKAQSRAESLRFSLFAGGPEERDLTLLYHFQGRPLDQDKTWSVASPSLSRHVKLYKGVDNIVTLSARMSPSPLVPKATLEATS